MATCPRTHRLIHSHTNKPPTAGVQLVGHTGRPITLDNAVGAPVRLLRRHTATRQNKCKDITNIIPIYIPSNSLDDVINTGTIIILLSPWHLQLTED